MIWTERTIYLPVSEQPSYKAGGSLGAECLPRNAGITLKCRVVDRNLCVCACVQALPANVSVPRVCFCFDVSAFTNVL